MRSLGQLASVWMQALLPLYSTNIIYLSTWGSMVRNMTSEAIWLIHSIGDSKCLRSIQCIHSSTKNIYLMSVLVPCLNGNLKTCTYIGLHGKKYKKLAKQIDLLILCTEVLLAPYIPFVWLPKAPFDVCSRYLCFRGTSWNVPFHCCFLYSKTLLLVSVKSSTSQKNDKKIWYLRYNTRWLKATS